MSAKRACPTCGRTDLRKKAEGENEFVLVPKRECKACGTVFAPPVSPLWAGLTGPAAAGCLAFAGWGEWFADVRDRTTLDYAVWITFLAGLVLAFGTCAIISQRNGKVFSAPKPKRDAQPWDTPGGTT